MITVQSQQTVYIVDNIMAYVNPDSLNGVAIALVYIAGKTSEAKAVEALLTQNELIYTIKSTPFMHSSIFGGLTELPGVGFYVPSEQAESCRDLLRDRKFKVGLVLDGEE